VGERDELQVPDESGTAYPLALTMAVTLETVPVPQGRHALLPERPDRRWTCAPKIRNDIGGWRDAQEGDGVAQALVDVIRHQVSPMVPGFRVVRLVPPPEATGERTVTVDQTNTSVVVGERVVVKWMRDLSDAVHPGPTTLAHLAAVDFLGVPVTHGLLLWKTPGGQEVPCAVVTGYLPRARDGWEWCVDAAAQAMGLTEAVSPAPRSGSGTGALPLVDPWLHDFPARLGRLTAKLHIALARPSRVIPEPSHQVDFSVVRRWHASARRRLEDAIRLATSLDRGEATLRPRVEALAESIDSLLSITDSVLIQRIHADLHVGQILRWPGGLAVIDFDGNPIVDPLDEPADTAVSAGTNAAVQPAARDVAQMLRSIDHVARIVDKRTGFANTATVDAWSTTARAQLLNAYRRELSEAEHSHLLDERLLPAFEAEQVCRELIYSARHLKRWAYAPLGSLRLMYPGGP
jgi:maltokinase